MGQDVEQREFSGKDRQRYRAKVRTCLDVFSRMLSESKFEFDRPMTGLEIELNLVDENRDPAMRNSEVLNAIANDDFQTELGQFNIEINVPPRRLVGSNAQVRSLGTQTFGGTGTISFEGTAGSIRRPPAPPSWRAAS